MFLPNLNLKIELFELTYCNDKFPMEAANWKFGEYAILQPLPTQLGWEVLPLIILMVGIRLPYVHKP